MTIEVKEELDFWDLMNKVWGQAYDTLNTIWEKDKEEEFMQYLNDAFCSEMPSLTEVNDLLAYDWQDVFNALDISEEEEEEGEE